MKLLKPKGFTLIELLVVIVIIGILATLATVALSAAKVKARDAKRISDIKQMQTALELYYNEENTYPPTNALAAGQALVGAVSGKTFMGKIPAGPNTGENYTYNQINGGTSYTLGYVLEKTVNEFAAGAAVALPGSINNQCTSDCASAGRCAGATDNCGKTCASSVTATAPATLTLTPGNAQMTIAWSAVANATSYTLYGNTNGSTNVLYTGPNLTYTNTGLTNGTTYYYTVAATVCSSLSAKSTQQSAVANVDFSAACTSGTALGSACGGGWLICSPTDGGNCADSPGKYVVVAPADLTADTWTNAVTACSGYHNTGDNNGTWSLPKLSSDTVPVTTLSGNRINNEMCQMMKRSNVCANMTTAAGCNVSSLCASLTAAQKPISGLGGSTYYWSSTEYNATGAWYQFASNGAQNGNLKSYAAYVRCVRRF